jgi:cobalt/nickel transport system ATP-binding protein
MSGFISGAGSVNVDGIEVKGKNTKRLRKVICSCLEDANDQLFMSTLFDDVAFGPLNMGLEGADIKQAVENALKTVGLEKMANKAPHHLSAGQKRAAALATVLSMDPKIITFDEPDGSLDPRNRNRLIEILKGLKQTLVIATCNMNFAARVADRVIVIDAGTIAADGDVEEILANRQLMDKHGLEVADVFC